MCLILFAYRASPGSATGSTPDLVIAANRDEAFRRPSDPAGFWADAPEVFAGRDRSHGGTWLGVTRQGRFAALTNFREPASHDPAAPSRGALVSDFLRTSVSAADYTQHLARHTQRWNGFNLLAFDGQALWYVSNRSPAAQAVTAGIHGLSNHLLDTPWPKVARGRLRLSDILSAAQDHARLRSALFTMLGDRAPAPDSSLPATGLPLERERAVSPAHILPSNPEQLEAAYGTRCATVLRISGAGVELTERTFDVRGGVRSQSHANWRLAAK